MDIERKSLLSTPQVQKMLFPEVVIIRTDALTEAIVDEGVRLLDSKGIQEASRFAHAHQVPLHVAKRVLLRPLERRGAKAS
jgi:hypothetical protein